MDGHVSVILDILEILMGNAPRKLFLLVDIINNMIIFIKSADVNLVVAG